MIYKLLKGYSFELILDYKRNKITLKAEDPTGKKHTVKFKANDGDLCDWWHGLEVNGINLDINIYVNFEEGKPEYQASLYPVTITENNEWHADWQDQYSIKNIVVKSDAKEPKKSKHYQESWYEAINN